MSERPTTTRNKKSADPVANQVNEISLRMADRARTTLKDAIEAGKLLTEKKKALKKEKVKWGDWCDENLLISQPTVSAWMRLHENRKDQKVVAATTLRAALGAVAGRTRGAGSSSTQERKRADKDREKKEGGKAPDERVMEFHYSTRRAKEVENLLTKLAERFHTKQDADTIYKALKYVKEHFDGKDNSATDKAA